MITHTVTLNFEKSTKQTHVYNEPESADGSPRIFPTIYVQKTSFGNGKPPPTIKVTLEIETE